MKILYLTQYFSVTRGGGGEVVFYNLANGMAKRGHDVYVMCHGAAGLTAADNEINKAIKIFRIRPLIKNDRHLLSPRDNLLYIINAIIKASQVIKNEKVDIIHANNFSPVIAGSVLSKLHNIPLVITIHDFVSSSQGFWKKWAAQESVPSFYGLVGKFYEKLTVSVPTDIIHTVSNSTKEDLMKYKVKHKVAVIYNGMDYSSYDKIDFKREFESYALFIGRLIFYKNVDILIKSFKDVVKKLPDTKLVIVGDGPMLSKWQKMVVDLGLSQKVEFTGFVSHERKLQLLGNSSLLLLPSLFEGFPMVLLEAFALGKPVIVSDVHPYDEIVDDGVNGFIVPAHDIQKWSEKIILLLSNRSLCENMGRNGRIRAENEFAIDTVMEKMESIYNDVCLARKNHGG